MVGVVESHRVAFFGIHKAATSSVKLALYELREGREWSGDPMKVHPKFPNDRIDAGTLRAFSDYWCFTVIRDPIRRFLSAYQNRVVDYRDLIRLPGGRGRGAEVRATDLDLPQVPDIETFIANYDTYCRLSYSIFIHTCSSKVFIGDDLAYFDAIYTTAMLDDLQADLSRRANQPVAFRRVNESTTAPPRFEDLSPAAQAFLIDHTAEDYAFFADYFTPPKLHLQ